MERKLLLAFEAVKGQLPPPESTATPPFNGRPGLSRHTTFSSFDAFPLQDSLIHLLRRATMLIHYVDMNTMAIRKLIKVNDRLTDTI